jgi:hypothetical protein
VPSPVKPSAPLSKAEFTALGAIAKARQDNLATMFAGSSVVYAGAAKLKAVGALGLAGRKIYTNAKVLPSPGQLALDFGIRAEAERLIVEAVGVVTIGDLIGAITNEAVEQLVKEMTPYVGIIHSSYKAAQAWQRILENARRSLDWESYTGMVLPGDPVAACKAVRVILERNMARDTITAHTQTAAAAAKIAGLAGDFGTGASGVVVGLASGLASLAVTLTQLGIDIREMRAGNRALESPVAIDKSIFTACPIVGSYLLAYSPTSMILNFFVADIGLPGWMSKIEKFKKEGLDPVVETATEQIARSRITMVGFTTGKGFVPEKSVGGKLQSLKWKNMKFQFNRLVRSQLPF